MIRHASISASACVAVALLASASPAASQSAFSWGGFYAGGSLGAGSANYALSGSYRNPALGVGARLTLPAFGAEGGLIAAQLGYNQILSENVVAGVQLDGAIGAIDNSTSGILRFAGRRASFNYRLRARSMVTVTGRLGLLSTPDTMIYGLLGATRSNFQGDLSLAVGRRPPVAGSYGFNLNGVVAGVGMETRVSRNATLALEYRYNRFARHSLYDGPALGGDRAEFGFNTSIQTVRASYNIHF